VSSIYFPSFSLLSFPPSSVSFVFSQLTAHNHTDIIRHGNKIGTDARDKNGRLTDPLNNVQCLSATGYARAYNLKSVFGPGNTKGFKVPDALFSMNYNLSFECINSFGIFRTQATIEPLAQFLNLTIDNTTSPMPEFCNSSGGTENREDKPMLINATYAPSLNRRIMDIINAFPAEPMPAPSGSGWILPARKDEEAAFQERMKTLVSEEGTCAPFGDVANGTCCNPANAAVMKAKLFQDDINTVLVAWEHQNIKYLPIALGVPEKDIPKWKDDDFDSVFVLNFDPKTGELEGPMQVSSQGFVDSVPPLQGIQ